MSKRTRMSQLDKVFEGTDEHGAFVGLDVHKRSIHVAVWLEGRVAGGWVMAADTARVTAMLAAHSERIERVVYEAGPTGYTLARALSRAGLVVEVVAPGRSPRPAVQEQKSDRLDAERLAEYAAKDMLVAVAVPSEQQEADRQLMRSREQVVRKRRRVKQQIKSFLLQHGLAEPRGLSGWSLEAVAALRMLALGPALRVCLDLLLDQLGEITKHVRRIERALSELAATARHAELVALARTHPGVGPVVAMSYVLEVHRDGRFETPGQVASYIGLAPRVRQSGPMRRDGPIMRTGRACVRALLVEAAWRWRMNDPKARLLYARVMSNTGSAKKAIVALARHLAINLWAMLTRREAYRPGA